MSGQSARIRFVTIARELIDTAGADCREVDVNRVRLLCEAFADAECHNFQANMTHKDAAEFATHDHVGVCRAVLLKEVFN